MPTVVVNIDNMGEPKVAQSSEDEVFGLVALSLMKGVGFHTLANAASKGISFWSILSAEPAEGASLLRRCGARISPKFEERWKLERAQILSQTEALLNHFHDHRISLFFRNDRLYPPSLFDLADPPHWLFVQGEAALLRDPSITIVGTRNPSDDGLWLSRFVGHCLPIWRAPTVSGLAIGIDQSIHHASLQARLPTIAVLGTGILSNYPRNSDDMRNEIVRAGGAVITEYLPNDTYSAENFVRRNRLQAALGRILIPVEWKSKSGTAHTVRFAQRLRRPIANIQIPSWPSEMKHFSKGANSALESTFDIPGDEGTFRDFVSKALGGKHARIAAPIADLFGRL